jgi:flagellin-specific chaperone FliS
MTEQLVKANLENSKDPLLSVQKLMETLLAAWKQAVDEVNKNSTNKQEP